MSLRLYLDDSVDSLRLRTILRASPYLHHVVRPADAGLLGANDDRHFVYAHRNDLMIITKDPDDFLQLHAAEPSPPGLFLVYQDNRHSDMQPADIARAIQNLQDAGIPLHGEVHVLNRWRF